MAVPNMDVFEAYFKRADLDGDARITVAEGVSFFQGSNLPQQVRADRIQSDLDEILKALTEQCKKHGLTVNSTAVIELPFGFHVFRHRHSGGNEPIDQLKCLSNLDSSENERGFFGSNDFGLKPLRTGSTSPAHTIQKNSIFFEESVAGSSLSRFSNSPSMTEGGFSPRVKLKRFYSINSSKDFGHSRAFSSFDDSDPFGSGGPFKGFIRESNSEKKVYDNRSSF
ncbi:EH DOMAIN [Salix koriyanagi]|uniref:EH DOMAIN n=1 Tax=Salix koriyanagi TaxID=2511006 RepID=A0A9Q0P3K2_9ROSI|nr:EH DOMAIN [Salix koriyanagi]